jgi:hypothetical protein
MKLQRITYLLEKRVVREDSHPHRSECLRHVQSHGMAFGARRGFRK